MRREGDVPSADLEALERLARLVEIGGAARPRRWPEAALLAGALILVSALSFVEFRSTEVDMRATVSEVGFRLARTQRLTSGVPVNAFGLGDVARLELPGDDGRVAVSTATPDHPVAVELVAGGGNVRREPSR